MERRDFKTNPQQWKVVMDFVEEYPMLLKPHFTHSEGDSSKIAGLWEELARRLNSMGFGERNVEKWKAAIGRWRSKTKAKASLIRTETKKTGGGSSKAVPLTDTEERLLQLVGWRTVTGDGNVELGMGPSIQPSVPQPWPYAPVPSISEHETSHMLKSSSLPQESIASTSTAKSPPPLVPVSARPSGKKRTRLSTDRSRKMVTVNHMHQETLKELRDIRQSLAIVANSHKEISADMKRLVNLMIDRK